MLDYIALIVILALFALLRNHLREKRLRKKQAAQVQAMYRPPEEQRVTSLFNNAAERLRKKGMEWLLLEDYHFRTIVSTPGSVPLAETQKQLQSALMELLSHVHIMPDVTLEVTDDPAKMSSPNRAGEYSHDYRSKVIRVLTSVSSRSEDLMDTLCHEATHYIMYSLNIQAADPDLNEGLTEVTTCLLGFTETRLAAGGNRNSPYLNKPEFEIVQRLLRERRAAIRQQQDRAAELEASRQQLRKNLEGGRVMLEQVRAMIAVNKTPGNRRMSKAELAMLQQAMLRLETGVYEESFRRAEARLRADAAAVRQADQELLAVCGDLFRIMLAFRQ